MMQIDRILQKMNRLTLAKKLIVAMFVLTTILILIVSIFNYTRLIKTITIQQSVSSAEILQLKKQNFEAYLNQIGSYSLSLRNDDKFMQIIGAKEINNFSDVLYVQGQLRNMFYSRKDVTELKMYLVNYGYNYTLSRYIPNMKSAPNKIEGDFALRQASLPKYFIHMEPAPDAPQNTLRLWRSIINISDQKALAYVEMTLDHSFLANLANGSSSNQDLFYLVDSGGRLYYTNASHAASTETLRQLTRAIPTNSTGNFIHEIDQVPYLVVYCTVDNADFILISLIPKSRIDNTAASIRNTSLIIAFSALAVSVCLILLLIHALLKPLNHLADQMQIVGSGNFKLRIETGGSAEIDHLARQFNAMLARIDELIERTYVAELNEKMSHLQALEAQINPHFLNNTLQAISAQAILKKQRGISKMIQALASMLRYTITEGDTIPISAEIQHVRDYLMLQQARFADRLKYSIENEEDLNDTLIPKISILTMVENTINHCLEKTLECVVILVRIQSSGEYLSILVEDNGCGMTQERLDEVREQLQNEGNRSGSIGLKNLVSRLRILYEGKASLNISSSLGTGTVVEMRIPKREDR